MLILALLMLTLKEVGIYSYTFDFDTFKNDTFKRVIFRYSQKWLFGLFWHFWRKFWFRHFQEWHFSKWHFCESVWVDRHPQWPESSSLVNVAKQESAILPRPDDSCQWVDFSRCRIIVEWSSEAFSMI